MDLFKVLVFMRHIFLGIKKKEKKSSTTYYKYYNSFKDLILIQKN